MNESLQSKLSEVVGANNISYILKDNKDFSVTGYKVMQNQSSSGLLRCAKIMYNGNIKLVYIVEGNKPLSYVATRLGVNELNAVIFNLIQRAMDIKANGFFRAENLELDFNKIFVDTSDYSVHLIYFPLSGGATGKISSFENEFRIALINLFNSFPVFNAPQFQRLCSDLANGSLPLDMIMKKLQDNVNGNNYNQKNYERSNIQPDYSAQRVTPVTPVSGVNSNYQNQGIQNQGIQNQGIQNQGIQNQGIQNQGIQNQGIQNQGIQNQGYQQPVQDNGFRNQGYQPVQQFQQPVLTLTAINSPVDLVLTVDQPEYLIGKNPNMVNGAITYNPAISRVHCKITYFQGRYYLTDMGSANGTCVNQQRVEQQQTVEINSGDCIKLANSDFVISF